MTLRMVFGQEDLLRVRVASAPDPMWEVVLSLHQLRQRRLATRHASWWYQAHQRLQGSDRAPHWLSVLCTLVPPTGRFPDFLTPARTVSEFEAGCADVACTPPGRLRSDLSTVFTGRRAPGWVRDLAAGDRRQLHQVAAAARQAYDMLVAPWWTMIRDSVGADRQARISSLAGGGLSNLLGTVPGVLGWDGDTLELRYPETRTVRLAGRGLTLVPSYFCTGTPVTLIDANLPPVLIYPATAGRSRPRETGPTSPETVALLGRTRAECMTALSTPHTTSALATALGTSVGTASKQATVLRDAGLIASERRGSAVLHRLTALGAAVLRGDPCPP